MTKEEILKDMRELLSWADWHSRVDCVFDLTKILPILNKYSIKVNLAFEPDEDCNLTKEEVVLLNVLSHL